MLNHTGCCPKESDIPLPDRVKQSICQRRAMCMPINCEEEKMVKEAKEKADATPKAAAEIDTEADSEAEAELESELECECESENELEEGEEKKDEKKECSIPVMMPGCCCKKPLQQQVAEWYCNFDRKCDECLTYPPMDPALLAAAPAADKK